MAPTRRDVLRGGIGVAALGLAGCVDLADASRWSMFRGEGNNQASTRGSLETPLRIDWEYDLTGVVDIDTAEVHTSSPVADDVSAYVAFRMQPADGTVGGIGVAAIDLATGEERWSRFVEYDHPSPDAMVIPPVIADDLITLFGATHAYVFDREQGHSRFDFPLPWVPATTPGADRFLIALGGQGIAMVDLEEDQGVRWDYPPDPHEVHQTNPPTVLDDRLYVPLDDGLIAMRRGDGIRLWQEPIPREDAMFTAPPLVDGYHLHLRVRLEDGTDELIALERGDRSIRWDEPLGPSSTEVIGMPAYRAGRLFASTDEELIAVFVGNGERDWSTSIDVGAPYPTVGGDKVYLVGDSSLVVFDRHAGDELDRVDLPGSAPRNPSEAVPREDVVVVSRSDSIIGIASD